MLLYKKLKCILGKNNLRSALEFHRLKNPRYTIRGLGLFLFFSIKQFQILTKVGVFLLKFFNFEAQDKSLNRIRNIGLIAHVDAGKTTTSERMLYFSGFVPHFGNHKPLN